MNIDFDYAPTAKQNLFHETTAHEVLYGGAAGGGKSYAICWDALNRCLMYKKTHAYLFRRTYPELEQTLIQTMLAIVPSQLGRYRASAHEMRLKNGSVIHFCYLDNEGKGLLRYQGAEIHWLYFDELTHFTQQMYEYLRTRLRANKRLGIVPCVRCASNPGGPGHSWVKAYFVDKTDVGKKTYTREVEIKRDGKVRTARRVIQYIPATVRDNPHISFDYEVELQSKPAKLRDALLYGNWDAFSGQAFPEFIDDPAHYRDGKWTHVIEKFDIPWNWTRVVSFDHGYSRPFSFGVWAVDPDGRVYRYKELYGCKKDEPNTGIYKTPGEIADMLADLMQDELREGIRVMGVADPAIWDCSRGYSVEEQIRMVLSKKITDGRAMSGITFTPGDNTRLAGKMQLHERLKFDTDGRPMMYVFPNCTEFLRTIPALAYDDKHVEDIDTDGEDHIYDETRYFLMSRPIAPRPVVEVPKRIKHPLD